MVRTRAQQRRAAERQAELHTAWLPLLEHEAVAGSCPAFCRLVSTSRELAALATAAARGRLQATLPYPRAPAAAAADDEGGGHDSDENGDDDEDSEDDDDEEGDDDKDDEGQQQAEEEQASGSSDDDSNDGDVNSSAYTGAPVTAWLLRHAALLAGLDAGRLRAHDAVSALPHTVAVQLTALDLARCRRPGEGSDSDDDDDDDDGDVLFEEHERAQRLFAVQLRRLTSLRSLSLGPALTTKPALAATSALRALTCLRLVGVTAVARGGSLRRLPTSLVELEVVDEADAGSSTAGPRRRRRRVALLWHVQPPEEIEAAEDFAAEEPDEFALGEERAAAALLRPPLARLTALTSLRWPAAVLAEGAALPPRLRALSVADTLAAPLQALPLTRLELGDATATGDDLELLADALPARAAVHLTYLVRRCATTGLSITCPLDENNDAEPLAWLGPRLCTLRLEDERPALATDMREEWEEGTCGCCCGDSDSDDDTPILSLSGGSAGFIAHLHDATRLTRLELVTWFPLRTEASKISQAQRAATRVLKRLRLMEVLALPAPYSAAVSGSVACIPRLRSLALHGWDAAATIKAAVQLAADAPAAALTSLDLSRSRVQATALALLVADGARAGLRNLRVLRLQRCVRCPSADSEHCGCCYRRSRLCKMVAADDIEREARTRLTALERLEWVELWCPL